jgi:hypothetical protein
VIDAMEQIKSFFTRYIGKRKERAMDVDALGEKSDDSPKEEKAVVQVDENAKNSDNSAPNARSSEQRDRNRLHAIFCRRHNDDAFEQAARRMRRNEAAATPSDQESAFAHADDERPSTDRRFLFAKWAKPIVPAFYGLEASSMTIMRSGLERAARICGAKLGEDDHVYGANLVFIVCQDWSELNKSPVLRAFVSAPEQLSRVLTASKTNQYRLFKTAKENGIEIALVLLRMDEKLSSLPPQAMALSQAAQALLVTADDAFAKDNPVTIGRHGRGLLKRWMQRLLEAAYREETPAYSEDVALIDALAKAMNAPKKRKKPGPAQPLSSTEDAAGNASKSSSDKDGPEQNDSSPSPQTAIVEKADAQLVEASTQTDTDPEPQIEVKKD